MIYDFFNKQEIQGITPYGNKFKGYVAERKNGRLKEQVAVNEEGQWLSLEEINYIEPIGRNIREEVEQTIGTFIKDLDPDKLTKINDTDKQAIYNVAIKKAGEDGEQNEDKVKQIVDSNLFQNELENSSDSDSSVVQKYMKEATLAAEPNAGDDIEKIKDEFIPTSKEMDQASSYSEEDLLTTLMDMAEVSNDSEQLINYVVEEGYSLDEAEEMVDKALGMMEGNVVDSTDMEDEISADEQFSQFMDDYEEENQNSNIDLMYEALCQHFNLQKEGKKAFKETNNYYDAILKLAEIYKS